MCDALASPKLFKRVRAELVEQTMRGATDELRRRVPLDSEIAEWRRQVAVLFEDRAANPPRITPEQYATPMGDMATREDKARRELDQQRDRVLSLSRDGSVDGLLALVEDVPRVLGHLDVREKRALLRELLLEVRVRMPGPEVDVRFRVPGIAAREASANRDETQARTPGRGSLATG